MDPNSANSTSATPNHQPSDVQLIAATTAPKPESKPRKQYNYIVKESYCPDMDVNKDINPAAYTVNHGIYTTLNTANAVAELHMQRLEEWGDADAEGDEGDIDEWLEDQYAFDENVGETTGDAAIDEGDEEDEEDEDATDTEEEEAGTSDRRARRVLAGTYRETHGPHAAKDGTLSWRVYWNGHTEIEVEKREVHAGSAETHEFAYIPLYRRPGYWL
jgi:hypothetical protein